MTTPPREELEQKFHHAMLGVYREVKLKVGYNATRFFHMVGEHGGLSAAQVLLATPEVSDGFTELYCRKQLKLSMEYLVLKQPWCQLFSEEELAVARKRLRERDCEPPPNDAS